MFRKWRLINHLRRVGTGFLSVCLVFTGLFTPFGFPMVEAAVSVSTGAYYYPSINQNELQDPNTHGLTTGDVIKDKIVSDQATKVHIERLSNNGERYGPVITNITLQRLDENQNVVQTITGKSLAYINLDREANAGYGFVDIVEAKRWIKALNGNEAYVLNGSTIISHDITYASNDEYAYTAYNIADIAQASGGRGVPNGDGLTKINDNLYRKDDLFQATPRPKANVNTNKLSYSTNESAIVTGSGTDYSIYDKGIIPVNLSAINIDTSSGYQSAPNSTTLTVGPPLLQGTYQTSFVMTDKHHRSSQDSSDLSVSKPAQGTFEVTGSGSCVTPTTATLKISGQSDKSLSTGGTSYQMPSGKNTISLVFPASGTLKVNGTNLGTGTTFSNILITSQTEIFFDPSNQTRCDWVKTFLPPDAGGTDPDNCDYIIHVTTFTTTGTGEFNGDIASDATGAAMNLNYRTDYLEMNADIAGKFFMNGAELPSSTGKTANIDYIPTDVFTLSFVSNDGTQCWVKTFYRDSGGGGGVSCPVIKGAGSTISNGEEITKVALNGSLTLKATYNNGDIQPANVFWTIKRPDGTISNYMWEEIVRDDDSYRKVLTETDILSIPYNMNNGNWNNSQKLAFDQVGRYEISWATDGNAAWEDEDCPPWKAYVVISACTNINVKATVNGSSASMSGTGQPGDEYKLTLPTASSVNTGSFSVRNGTSTTGVTGNWTLRKSNDAVPIATGNAQNPFSYTFTDPGSYILTVRVNMGGEICEKIIHISKFACDDVTIRGLVSSNPINPKGSGSAGDPYVIKMIAGQPNDVRLRAENDELLSGEWTLKRGSTTVVTRTTSLFDYTLPVSSETYTLAIRVMLEGEYCYRYVRFETQGLTCNDIYLHFFDDKSNQITYNVAPAPGHTGSKTIATNKLGRFVLMVSDKPNTIVTNDGASLIEVTWQASRPNQDTFDPRLLYERLDTEPGTYTIKATVNDSNYSVLNGCTFTFTLVIDPDGTEEPPLGGCTDCNPGGPIDGGQMKIRVYDSDNRLLRSTADGVWQKEPARIEVTIDQADINAAFSRIDAGINKAVQDKKAEFMAKYPAPEYEDVVVTPTPPSWNSRTNSQTRWPTTTRLTVNGPGTNQAYALNPKLQTQSNIYTGTVVPTQTTWQSTLQSQKYQVRVDDFTILVPYSIQFAVNYQKCEEKSPGDDPDTGEPLPPEKTCTPATDTGFIENSFTITVRGDQTQFEVFEPNAKGYLLHTTEWSEYHSRDRYPGSQPDDFYAGERILTKLNLDAKHKHPFSGKYPGVIMAQAWIAEIGLRSTQLQSILPLQASSPTVWSGPQQLVAKLGTRQVGVDTLLMGDKQQGFKKGSSYAVYYYVQFNFSTVKGYSFPDKTILRGHDQADYRTPFHIIANAWERQGIRNHTSH